jgi:GT2 family glycosyltransferase
VAWSREIRDCGWKIYYVAESTVVHRERAARRQRSWVSELDWVHAHRRLLYRYDGTRAGIVGDLLFTAHLAAQGVGRVSRGAQAPSLR